MEKPTFFQRIKQGFARAVAPYILAIGVTAGVSSCSEESQAPENQPAQGCTTDNDCHGDRICNYNNGRCEPSQGNGSSDAGSLQDTNSRDTGGRQDTGSRDQSNNDPPLECTPHAERVCYDGDVHWRDSCGGLEGVAEDCRPDQYCNNARCVDEEPVCNPHTGQVCSSGNPYWTNSCGELEERLDDCRADEVCTSARCVPIGRDAGSDSSSGEDVHSVDYGHSDSGGSDIPVGATYLSVIIVDLTAEASSSTNTAGVDICGVFAENRYGERIPPFSVDNCRFGSGDNSAATVCDSFARDTCYCDPNDPDFVSLGGRGGSLVVGFYPPLADGDRVVVHECAIENDSYDLFVGQTTNPDAPSSNYCGRFVDSSGSCLLPDDFR